jgi:hypothetical protein
MQRDGEQIWFRDPAGFIGSDNFTAFFPTREMTYAQQLNAITRFALYLGTLLALVRRSWAMLYIPLGAAAVTLLLGLAEERRGAARRESFTRAGQAESGGGACTLPTPDNPFMNVTADQFSLSPARQPACPADDPRVREATRAGFERNLYRDMDDIFGRNASDRQFYTTPSTTVPNDQGAFARFLYERGPSCKEGNGVQCAANIYRPHNSLY